MATVKTIKPAGGGDYTTLAAWEAWADDQASADQWAECYTGGDLGACTVSGWTATPDASNYPRIYAADGEGHGGDKTAGAYSTGRILIQEGYVQVADIRVSNNQINWSLHLNAVDLTVVERCLVHDYAGDGFYCFYGFYDYGPQENTIQNCLAVDCTTGFKMGSDIAYSGAGSPTMNLYNSTAYGCTTGIDLYNGGVVGANVNCENSIAMSCTTDFSYLDTGGGTVTCNNNLSDDATADDQGGTGHLINQTDTDVFTDPSNDDYTLRWPDSPAIDAGKTIASVTTDILGVSRPQLGAYDMGCFERQPPTIKTIKPAGGGDYTTLAAWEAWADDQASADQWAECYTGGDLGACTVSGWTATPDASNYPRIYAADGEGHGGDKTAGAYSTGRILIQEGYVQVADIRVSNNQINWSLHLNAVDLTVVERCLVHDYAGDGFYCFYGFYDYGPQENTIQNCLAVDCTTGFKMGSDIAYSGAGSPTMNLYNSTAYGCTTGIDLYNGGVVGANVNCENSIAMSCTTDFSYLDTGGGTVTCNNNLSDDATADDEGGTGHLINQTDTDVFTDPSNDDYTLKWPDSPALDAGKTVASVTDDIIDTSRPQWNAYDMGCFEAIGSSCPQSPVLSHESTLSATLDADNNIATAEASSAIDFAGHSLAGFRIEVVGLESSELTFYNNNKRMLTVDALFRKKES